MEKSKHLAHHKRLKRKLWLKLSLLWLVLIIVGSTAVGMLIQYGLQNTSILQTLLTKKIDEQNLNQEPLILTKIRSEKLGYELVFNPLIFRADRATNTDQADLNEIGLTTQDTLRSGFGLILFSAYTEDELADIVKQSNGADNLEKSANWYQSKKLRDLTDTSTFVSKEKIQRWGTDTYRLNYKRQLFGKEVFHYVYVVIKNNKLYTVMADYPKLGVSSDVIESWIDEIAFITPNMAEVQAETTAQKLDLNEVKLVELNKPSVVQIVTVNCIAIKVKDLNRVKVLKPKYEICNGGSGSGFMVGKDGLVATNGHVAKASFEDLVYSGRPEPGSGNFFIDFQKELIAQTLPSGDATDSAQPDQKTIITKSPSLLDAVIEKYTDFEKQGIFEKAETTDKYFVKLGNDPIRFNKVTTANRDSFSYKSLEPVERSQSVMDAEFVAADFGGTTALTLAATQAAAGGAPIKRERSSDVALIKLKGKDITAYPGVPMLSSNEVKEGEQIIVVGFPGLVSGQDPKAGFLLDETVSSVRPTITRGIISALKQDTFGQMLLQTDASIEHGNSGGPAFNYLGDVIGIATYVISSGSGNYNFLRSTDDLMNLWEANQGDRTETSASYNAWRDGLAYFWQGKFTKAKEQFTEVKKLYPIHPQVDEYISNAEKGIETGQDTELNPAGDQELKSFGYTQQQITLFIAAIMTVLIIVGGIITTYFIYDHKKNMNVILAVQAPPPAQTTPPSTAK